jgi:hypothetical protein
MNWARAGALIQRPIAREVILLACAGLFMATVGAFNTRDPGVVRPAVYWMVVVIAGGLVGVALEIPLAARIQGRLRRAVVLTLVMSAPVMVIVWLASGAVWGSPLSLERLLGLWPSVLLVCAALNAIRYGVRREPLEPAAGETQPAPGMLFRQRLSARGRAAPIYAVEAQDHYLRVHTGAGTELVLMRFGDALVELDGLGSRSTGPGGSPRRRSKMSGGAAGAATCGSRGAPRLPSAAPSRPACASTAGSSVKRPLRVPCGRRCR